MVDSLERGSGGFLPDVAGPDGVRISVRIEPAVARLVRIRDLWTTPKPWFMFNGVVRASEPVLAQSRFFKGQWVIDVESDDGDRRRLRYPSRADAFSDADRVCEVLRSNGVAGLR